ncbi:hypothetical protein ACFWOG_32500 [Kitasatospora sp. NPDC058406]|uniref:hypothetical protein n=1 Tax=Kitasatospora sp. NPDC058406 TaxID=3346483 RepID=UPI00365C21E0
MGAGLGGSGRGNLATMTTSSPRRRRGRRPTVHRATTPRKGARRSGTIGTTTAAAAAPMACRKQPPASACISTGPKPGAPAPRASVHAAASSPTRRHTSAHAPAVPAASARPCCAIATTEHRSLGGTVIRTHRHQAACPVWTAR